MNKIYLTATSNHYLYSTLSSLPNFLDYHSNMILDPDQILIDFSLTPKDEKLNFLSKNAQNIFSDLTLYDHRKIIIRGKFSSVFPSPQKRLEVVADAADQAMITDFFQQLELKPIFVKDPGFSFIFPRILVQIINEACFALEEKVASEKDIDTAMLFGVNYPVGPMSWGKEAGLSNVKFLLNELYHMTRDERYRLSKSLEQI
ncbi:MAG: 3-hydroxyacyl-CoA dehydrogenase family protein [Bacteriovoracaceae bacterium]